MHHVHRSLVRTLLLATLAVAAVARADATDGGAPLPAFPGAVGFGAVATGGRGGSVYHVTTLADSGPGSFRDAVSQPHRIVVFDVGGLIRLKENLDVASDITVAGQTAPGSGICLYGRGVSLGGHHNIILRYLRFREGVAGDRGKKSLGMDRADHIIVDHCSIEWGRWDDLGITVGSHDITIQDCLIAEAVNPQSFGALIDKVTNVTLARNLWMSNESRNPKAKGTIQFINNVVYNWAFTGLCGGHSAADHWLDVIGNYFVAGPSSNNRFAGQFLATDHVFQQGNEVDLDRDGRLNGHEAADSEFHRQDEDHYTAPTFVSTPAMHPAIPVPVESAAQAFQQVAAGAGCSLFRDAVDRRLIDELRSLGRRGRTLPHRNPAGEALVGGQPEMATAAGPEDTDRDGIPDAWEIGHGLNPHDPADAKQTVASGYTQIEVYLAAIVGQ
ncbi:MAG TPA: hypothetical protein VHE61_06015 [Opitutaceae bacterium]|nr:hypothetical protein [Opitutaceae bacterium]